MASSLAKINEQIARLQKQAEAIQSTVIARIKREIAKHGLTAEHLFDTASTSGGNAKTTEATKARPAAKARKGAAGKPIKFADGAGNTWHGVGKRPSWIHEALSSGRSLEEFLVNGKGEPAVAKAKAKPAKKANKAKKAATVKRPSVKRVAETAKQTVTVKASPRRATKTAANAKKAPAKKSTRKAAATAQGTDAQASQAAA
jgi:DNA-binding protein H-NS